MDYRDRIAVIIAKCISSISQSFHFGVGATWPGEIALMLRPHIASIFAKQLRKGVILIAGTNGKTTTSLIVKQILEHQGLGVVHNTSGANLLNGVVSAFIHEASWSVVFNADWGVFEVDENSLPLVTKQLTTDNLQRKTVIVLLNLFRDQLDRYGEVDVIVEKWESALRQQHEQDQQKSKASKRNSIYILNADDPAIVYLGKNLKGQVVYFGLNDKKHFLKNLEHATDSIFCLNCGGRLNYEGIYYSHIGIWRCDQCGFTRPKPDVFEFPQVLMGLYNQYNTLAAVATAHALNIPDDEIKEALKGFEPAFGRQEEFIVDGPTSPNELRGVNRKIQIFLSKNPAGFNASLRTVLELGAKNFLLVLNDRIPDGRDVSWIWDVDFETIPKDSNVVVSGDRVYDLAIRLKYARATNNEQLTTDNKKREPNNVQHITYNMTVEPKIADAIKKGLALLKGGEIFYILPTYSAMLEVRKILTGRKIL